MTCKKQTSRGGGPQLLFLRHIGAPRHFADLQAGADRATSSGFMGIECDWSAFAEELEVPGSAWGSASDSCWIGGSIFVTLTGIPANVASGASLLDRTIGQAYRCSVLGVPICLRVSGPAVPAVSTRYQDRLNCMFRTLKRVRWRAEQCGVTVCVQAGSDGCFLSPPELREFIDHLHSSAFGVYLDETQVLSSGVLNDWLTTLGPRVRVLRLGNRSTTADRGEDVPDRLRAIAIGAIGATSGIGEIGFRGAVIVDDGTNRSPGNGESPE